MTYNLTNLTGATTVSDIVTYANEATHGIMVMLFVMALFFIAFMNLKKNGFVEASAVSGFICFVVSGYFTYAKMLTITFPLFFLAVIAFSLMYLYVRRD
jgi:hypothetical protein